MSEPTLPCIYKSVAKCSLDGQVMRKKELSVTAKDIHEAKKIFDDVWEKEDLE